MWREQGRKWVFLEILEFLAFRENLEKLEKLFCRPRKALIERARVNLDFLDFLDFRENHNFLKNSVALRIHFEFKSYTSGTVDHQFREGPTPTQTRRTGHTTAQHLTHSDTTN
jgi:hypothetical protein